jgi:hypothetical protein
MENKSAIVDKLLSGQYPLPTVLAVFGGIALMMYIFRKALIKHLINDRLGVATKEELKKEITNLKENDLFHISKAMLLIGSEVLKHNPERFNRVKDTIMEGTPESRRDEIKSINIEEDKS